ncbi:MAG: lipid II flippase MurJ, partial [Acetobacteraceae bacterium]|nr:lipid II flippase MurJ [Acetobacteraceae bacterium]
MLKGILTVGGWTMASRVLGFARDMLIAARLGAGPLADAFFVALQLPNLFRRLFGEGAFNAAFIPAFAGTLATQGPQAARDLAERMLAMMAVWLSSLVLLGILLMPQIMALMAPGFAKLPDKLALAVELTRITFPYLLFICLTALVSGVLNGLDRFAAAAAAPIFFNLISMATLLGLTPYVATPAHALAWGVTASGVVQLALVLWAAAKAGMALRLWRPPSL